MKFSLIAAELALATTALAQATCNPYRANRLVNAFGSERKAIAYCNGRLDIAGESTVTVTAGQSTVYRATIFRTTITSTVTSGGGTSTVLATASVNGASTIVLPATSVVTSVVPSTTTVSTVSTSTLTTIAISTGATFTVCLNAPSATATAATTTSMAPVRMAKRGALFGKAHAISGDVLNPVIPAGISKRQSDRYFYRYWGSSTLASACACIVQEAGTVTVTHTPAVVTSYRTYTRHSFKTSTVTADAVFTTSTVTTSVTSFATSTSVSTSTTVSTSVFTSTVGSTVTVTATNTVVIVPTATSCCSQYFNNYGNLGLPAVGTTTVVDSTDPSLSKIDCCNRCYALTGCFGFAFSQVTNFPYCRLGVTTGSGNPTAQCPVGPVQVTVPAANTAGDFSDEIAACGIAVSA